MISCMFGRQITESGQRSASSARIEESGGKSKGPIDSSKKQDDIGKTRVAGGPYPGLLPLSPKAGGKEVLPFPIFHFQNNFPPKSTAPGGCPEMLEGCLQKCYPLFDTASPVHKCQAKHGMLLYGKKWKLGCSFPAFEFRFFCRPIFSRIKSS